MGIHPPKVETFDVTRRTNTDPKGYVRAVEEYREGPHGLYVSRPMPGHTSLLHLRSWLLPGEGLRITDFTFRPDHERAQDWYLDVVDITREGTVWRTEDHYLDLVVLDGRSTGLLDTDEYVEAVAGGLLAPDAAVRALETSHRAIAGLSEHGHDLGRWLESRGITLDWT